MKDFLQRCDYSVNSTLLTVFQIFKILIHLHPCDIPGEIAKRSLVPYLYSYGKE